MHASTGITFWTIAFLDSVARRPVLLSSRTRTFWAAFTQRVPSWRAGPRTLSVSFGVTSFLWVVFRYTIDLSSSVRCFFLGTCSWLQQLKRRAFQVVFKIRETLLTNCLFLVSDHHLFKSGVFSRFTSLNFILNVHIQQWLQLF